jgi:hypothetical protein
MDDKCSTYFSDEFIEQNTNVILQQAINWSKDNLKGRYNTQLNITATNGEIIITGDVIINNAIEELPYKIHKVIGNVVIDNSLVFKKGKFKSLKNMPDIITGNFNCSNNPIKSLKDGPKEVGGTYWCQCCELTDLNGLAHSIGGSLLAFNNNIADISVINTCNIGKNIDITNNPISHSSNLLAFT